MASDAEPSVAALQTAGLLFRHANRLIRRLRASRAPNSLGVSKLGILARLHQDGPTTAKVLADYLGLQPQSMTRLLSTMENASLIHRQQDQSDRRQVTIELTGQGRQLLLEDLALRRQRLARSLTRALTTAEIELLRIAAGLMDRATAAIEPAAPSHEAAGIN